MEKPVIFLIDDDPQVLRAIGRDLRGKYSNEYKIVQTASPADGLEILTELRNAAAQVCIFISDHRMPEKDGVQFLSLAMEIFPTAKKILLTAYSDTDAAIRAINDIQLDYYLLKPWDPPEDKLFPIVDDLLADWSNAYRPGFKGIHLIGYQYAPSSHAIKDYLGSNLVPFKWLDLETNPEGRKFLSINSLTENDLPVVFFEDGSFVVNPEISAIAAKTGCSLVASNDVYDVVVIGAGPAGLAAAVYGASEGLKTLLIEKKAPGGQAGTSSRIENYLGFPNGLSGADLTRRAITQASRLGAEFINPCTVSEVIQENGFKLVMLENGDQIVTRSIIVTTGVDYRKLEVDGMKNLTGAGVYYGASTTEASACRNKNVFILGGGNSAGQSAVYLSNFASRVFLVVRRNGLSETMSSYLIDQINKIPNIEIIGNTKIVAIQGNDRLERVVLKNSISEEIYPMEASALHIFIGARPFTDWISKTVQCDEKGFIETGRDLRMREDFQTFWKHDRDPFLLETSMSGVFAAGDVRAGSMARVASAVGEGSMAISFVHKYLAEG